MRCNIKVAYRDSVIHPVRSVPTVGGNDSDFCRDWFDEWIRQYDAVLKAMDKEQAEDITPRMARNAERAIRYDGWAWVTVECHDRRDADGTAFIVVDVRVNNINRTDEASGIVKAANDVAACMAEIVVHLREVTARQHPECEPRKRVRWDERNKFFARAVVEEECHWRRKRVEELKVVGVKLCPSMTEDGYCKAGANCKCVKFRDGVCADAEATV